MQSEEKETRRLLAKNAELARQRGGLEVWRLADGTTVTVQAKGRRAANHRTWRTVLVDLKRRLEESPE